MAIAIDFCGRNEVIETGAFIESSLSKVWEYVTWGEEKTAGGENSESIKGYSEKTLH